MNTRASPLVVTPRPRERKGATTRSKNLISLFYDDDKMMMAA
jgi:hypothetical protein